MEIGSLQLSAIERRMSSRIDLMIPVSIYSNGKFTGFAFSKNIGLGGMLLVASGLQLSLNIQLELNIHVCFNEKLNKKRVSAVVRRMSGDCTSVQFHDTGISTVSYIMQYLDKG